MKTLDEVKPGVPVRGTDLPLDITQPGSYYLAEDISVGAAGITISASDVTLDLAGHSLRGGAGSGISVNALGVEIKNGTVSGWALDGINIFEADFRIQNVRIRDNGRNGITVSDAFGEIRNCMVLDHYGTPGHGIYTENLYFQVNIVDTHIQNNGGWGILGDHFVARNCAVASNFEGGISAADSSSVVGCTLSYNRIVGIRSWSGSRVEGNWVSETVNFDVDSIGYDVQGDTVLVRNVADGNAINFNIGVPGPGIGPIGTAASSTSPWANISQ
jgi:hypothetical protein